MKSAFLRNSQNQCQTALFSFDIKRVPVFRLTPKKGGFEILKKKINLVRWAEGNRGDLTQNPDSGGPRGAVRRHLRIPPAAANRKENGTALRTRGRRSSASTISGRRRNPNSDKTNSLGNDSKMGNPWTAVPRPLGGPRLREGSDSWTDGAFGTI